MKPLNIYIHIPYCFAKCPYCAFYSCTNLESTYEQYFETLYKEIETKGEIYKDRVVPTIYIGGGTPNLVKDSYISKTIQTIKENFNLQQDIEISIEQYPQYINKESLVAYKQAGVNRISIGLQTTNNDDLKELTRRYTYEEFLEKYQLVKAMGFKNISIDLIFGYPNHTLEQWKDTLTKITDLDIQHISCYSLDIEEKSVYGKLYDQHKLNIPSDLTNRKMYHYACKFLNEKGFKQYEISNFAKEGYECKHNLNFWNYQDYLGLGAGAFSRVDKTRFNNIENVEEYIKGTKQTVETITDEDVERTILGLRLNKGIIFREDIFDSEYMIEKEGRMLLNTKGKDFYNQVVEDLL